MSLSCQARSLLLSGLVGLTAIAAYGQCAFENSQVAKAKADLTRTQQAIKSLGFQTDADQFQEWSNLSAEKSKEFQEATYNAIIDDVSAGFGKLLKTSNMTTLAGVKVNLQNGYASIGTAQARQIVSRMQGAGLTDLSGQTMQRLVRSLGSTTSKAQKADFAKQIVDLAGKEKDDWDIAHASTGPMSLEQKAGAQI